ncbi:MAG: transcription termination factor Rho [Actinomycetota bacterium]|jgi:transcription termination factor Rho
MSGEHQLERSVLEGKERDELHAIADALGVKPGSRTKKADLVDKILQATGVVANGKESNGDAPADKPKRTRATKKPAATAEAAESAPEASASDDAASAAPRRAFAGRAAALAADLEKDPAAHVTVTDIPTPDELVADAPAQSTGFAGKPRENRDGEARDRNQGERNSGGERNQQGGGGGGGGNQNRDRNQNNRDRNQGGGGGNQADGNKRGNRRRRGRDRFDSLAGGGGGQARDMAGYQDQENYTGETEPVAGLLDLSDAGYGLIRVKGYLPSHDDIYVPVATVKRLGLRKGDRIVGTARPATANEKYGALVDVESVSGMNVDDAKARPKFDDLTPLFPDVQLKLEMPGEPNNMVARIVDLMSPIGKGQRGLIVSPPKAGKTTVLKQIATSIEQNNPDVHLIVLLVDERPEEVTDMRRSVKGEVVASTFDRPSDEHTQVAELTIERAKRLVEAGGDVVIVLDGITRLARAYNLAAPATGRIMSGGIDTGALYPPKKFFGAARNLDEGGSLTILATALIETGSKMDEVIFEEFKGTGNMELRLDRRLAEKRIYPAIDVNASSTRREELLFDAKALQAVWRLRRVLSGLQQDGTSAAALDLLMDRVKKTKTNAEFLADVATGPSATA